MNPSMQPAIQHLFQVSTLEDVSMDELERLIRDHPCFGYGHFLLSRKLRAENDDRFLSVTQKASLHFSNPLWLQWMLDNAPESVRMRATQHTPDHASPIPESAPATPDHASPIPESAPATSDHASPIPESIPVIPESATAASTSQDSLEPPAVLASSMTERESQDDAGSNRADAAASTGPDMAESQEQSGEPAPPAWPEMESPQPPPATAGEQEPAWPNMEDPQASAAEILSDSIEKARELRQSLQKINEDFVARTGYPIPNREPVREETPWQQPIRDEEPPFVLEETEQQQAEGAAPANTATEAGGGDLGTGIPVGLAVPADNTPFFEPLHTIDYFASQGIRLTPEDNPTDQLGRQLKSFTEWLRMMRRLPKKDREIIPDRVAEEAVQHFAAHSIEGKEIVTETMAEVLAKQGMPERARLVYEKLSLLNPDKSAYFAAKIEQLNPH